MNSSSYFSSTWADTYFLLPSGDKTQYGYLVTPGYLISRGFSIKRAVLKNFAIFTGKHATLLKRASNTDVSLWILGTPILKNSC